MVLTLRPETVRFIDEQVKAGNFSSAEAVLEAAIDAMRNPDPALDDATIDAINEARAQGDRGEGVDIATFRAAWAKRTG